jgi:hypothetical protein
MGKEASTVPLSIPYDIPRYRGTVNAGYRTDNLMVGLSQISIILVLCTDYPLIGHDYLKLNSKVALVGPVP